MENMDKGLTEQKWVLINRPKIPQMPQNVSAKALKFGILMKKNATFKIDWSHCSHAYSISYFVLMILYDLKKENDDSFLLSARFIDYIAIRAPFFES